MNTNTAMKVAKHYQAELEARLKLASGRTERYRLTAELEDLEDGHWIGPRLDDPPATWEASLEDVRAANREAIIRANMTVTGASRKAAEAAADEILADQG